MKQAKSPYYAFTEQCCVLLQMQLSVSKQRIKEGNFWAFYSDISVLKNDSILLNNQSIAIKISGYNVIIKSIVPI